MIPYRFHEGEAPSGYAPDFEESLFNKTDHRLLQAGNGWLSVHIVQDSQRKIAASAHFHLHDGTASSPARAPFGSLEFSASLPPGMLFDFIPFFENVLKSKGASRLTIRHYPDAYNPDHSALLNSFLITHGYRVSAADVSSVLTVSSAGIEEGFNESVRRAYRKAQRSGFTWHPVPGTSVSGIYDFISGCYAKKNYRLSMDLSHLERSLALFPDRYSFFGVSFEERLIAASITVRVRSNVLYEYAHAHEPAFERSSPVIQLIAGTFGFCRENRITVFDLGTSNSDGKPDFNLLYFKRSLGCVASARLTFEKTLG